MKNNATRKIFQFTISGKFIAEFESASEASGVTGVSRQHIITCASKGRWNKSRNKWENSFTAEGFIWEYDMNCRDLSEKRLYAVSEFQKTCANTNTINTEKVWKANKSMNPKREDLSWKYPGFSEPEIDLLECKYRLSEPLILITE